MLGLAIALLYFGPLNSRLGGGQTIGKRVLNIRVTTAGGAGLGLGRSLGRALVLLSPFFNLAVPVPGFAGNEISNVPPSSLRLSLRLMMVRLFPIRVGARVQTRSNLPYELPAGLAADREVLVVSYDPQTYRHVVGDEAGREWTIKAGQNLNAGSE